MRSWNLPHCVCVCKCVVTSVCVYGRACVSQKCACVRKCVYVCTRGVNARHACGPRVCACVLKGTLLFRTLPVSIFFLVLLSLFPSYLSLTLFHGPSLSLSFFPPSLSLLLSSFSVTCALTLVLLLLSPTSLSLFLLQPCWLSHSSFLLNSSSQRKKELKKKGNTRSLLSLLSSFSIAQQDFFLNPIFASHSFSCKLTLFSPSFLCGTVYLYSISQCLNKLQGLI